MTGQFLRHRSSSRIGSVLLLGIIILWAETVIAETSTTTSDNTPNITATTEDMSSSTVINPTNATATATNAAATTINATATMIETTSSSASSIASKIPTTVEKETSTPTLKDATGRDGGKSGTGTDNKESATEKIGSVAVAGLCLVIVGLLLIAVNGYVFFKSRMGSCSSTSGVFHVLQMSAIKKNRSNESDVEDDVEDNFKEEDDIIAKETKESSADQAPEQNGEVHVQVDVTDIAGPSTDIDDDGEAKNSEENDDAASAAVVDENKKQEEKVEKSVETVVTVTVEGGIENQDEQP